MYDEKCVSSQLRCKGESIINRASMGDITPDKGIFEYIKESLNEVSVALKRVEKERKNVDVRDVLKLYETYLKEFQGIIKNDDDFLGKFLDIKIKEANQNEELKRNILQLRYKAIRDCQIKQGKLIQKIDKVSSEILKDLKKGKKRQPDYFKAAFRTVVIEHARSEENRVRLEKLFNFSPKTFESQFGESARYIKTKSLLSKYHAKIDFLVRDIIEDMRHLRSQEMNDRAGIIKDIRVVKQLTQKNLGLEIKKAFPTAAASQSTISRIEIGDKLVTKRIAMEFSRVLEVDPGLFMPHFYYE